MLYCKGATRAGTAWELYRGDAKVTLSTLSKERFNCVVTSPPYYSQRDYGVEGQIGLEKTIAEYVTAICATMDEIKRVLRQDGLLFLNLGDTYYSAKGQPKGPDQKNRARRMGLRPVDASGLGVPRKTIIGIPWRVALEMITRGWTLRSPVIWKRNGSMPEPTAHDRPWRTYETVFMFSKSPRYWFDRSSLGKDQDIWTISARPKKNGSKHLAPFPDELALKCIEIGCPPGGQVLDPFAGSGTVLRVALEHGRTAVGVDLSEDYFNYMQEELGRM
ncbi:MAG: site-specific DNA-methyltransferase [Planctomycetaceae bacterium]|nr:site-specific DNA-methyltransferase [Planctomycetaceae bacterium]